MENEREKKEDNQMRSILSLVAIINEKWQGKQGIVKILPFFKNLNFSFPEWEDKGENGKKLNGN